MARYKDVEGYRKLFDEEYKKTRKLISEGETHLDNLAEGFSEASRVIDRMPTADVAPKSEVAALGREVERLTNILNSYALQYGTVKDQHEVIDKAKAEAVKEFAERLKTYYRNLDKTAGALINYTIDQKLKEFLGERGGKENG